MKRAQDSTLPACDCSVGATHGVCAAEIRGNKAMNERVGMNVRGRLPLRASPDPRRRNLRRDRGRPSGSPLRGAGHRLARALWFRHRRYAGRAYEWFSDGKMC